MQINIESLCCTPETNIMLYSIISQFKKKEKGNVPAAGRRENGELLFNNRVSIWDDEKFWRWMVVM